MTEKSNSKQDKIDDRGMNVPVESQAESKKVAAREKSCVYCQELIHPTAKICHFCDRNQSKYSNLGNAIIRSVPLALAIVAFVQVILAYQQYYEARKERIEASEALKTAKNSEIALDSIRSQYQEKFQTISAESAKLQNRNRIILLGDDAIANGKRGSLERLMEMGKDSSDTIAQVAANSERLRVYTFYGGALYFYYELVDTLHNGIIKREYTASELIGILLHDSKWERRVASARLLESQKKEGVPEALVQCIRNDGNLHVVKHAILSFASVTGCKVKDLFGFDEVEKCWTDQSDRITRGMKPLNKDGN